MMYTWFVDSGEPKGSHLMQYIGGERLSPMIFNDLK